MVFPTTKTPCCGITPAARAVPPRATEATRTAATERRNASTRPTTNNSLTPRLRFRKHAPPHEAAVQAAPERVVDADGVGDGGVARSESDRGEDHVRVERRAPAHAAVARPRDAPTRCEHVLSVRAADGERHDRAPRRVPPFLPVRAQVDAVRHVAGDD